MKKTMNQLKEVKLGDVVNFRNGKTHEKEVRLLRRNNF